MLLSLCYLDPHRATLIDTVDYRVPPTNTYIKLVAEKCRLLGPRAAYVSRLWFRCLAFLGPLSYGPVSCEIEKACLLEAVLSALESRM